MSYQVLARKWRPRNFSEMVGQEHVLRALIHALDNDRLHHAFLFTGTRGVGKTTIARILAKSLNCEKGVSSTPCGECSSCREIDEGRFVDLIEVDAASRTRVEDTRELLDNVQYAPTRGRYKVYLVDEVHMLSGHSFNALLKTLEEPPPHVKFLLATTDPQKLPVTILSRCLQFNLKRLPSEAIRGYLEQLLGDERIEAESGALDALAKAADGSMRDALSLLDQAIAFGAGALREQEVREMLGTVDRARVAALLQAVADGDAAQVMAEVKALDELAPDYDGVLAELLSLLHRVALVQAVPDAPLDEGDPAPALAARLAPEDAQLYYQIGLLGRRDLPLAPEPRSGFEMVLLRMVAFRPETAAAPDGGGRARAAAAPAQRERPAETAAPVRAEAGAESQRTGRSQSAAPPVPAQPAPTESQSTAPAPTESAPTGSAPTGSAPTESAPTASRNEGDWISLAGTLPLSGVVRQLALNSVLQGRKGDHFRLLLEPSHAHFLNDQRRDTLRETLEQYIGRPVRLDIEVGEVSGITPAEAARRQSAQRQQEAESAIENDPNVQSILEHFGGQIEPGVRPIEGDG